jgi:hypothetical protein
MTRTADGGSRAALRHCHREAQLLCGSRLHAQERRSTYASTPSLPLTKDKNVLVSVWTVVWPLACAGSYQWAATLLRGVL